jgi:hypothetical protein
VHKAARSLGRIGSAVNKGLWDMTADQAITYIQSKRPIAFRPGVNFDRSIRAFEAAFNREVRPALAASK